MLHIFHQIFIEIRQTGLFSVIRNNPVIPA